MKKFLTALVFGLMAIAAQAEATFDQIEGLIEQRQYAAAASGLEVIIQNHPKSAKAFYAMAQAQAGLGNLEKAQKALDIATGLNPTLDFAPASSVASLRQAITPQTAKIEAVEESHALRNFVLFVMFAAFGLAMYYLWCVYNRKKDEEDNGYRSSGAVPPKSPTPPPTPASHDDGGGPRINSNPPRYYSTPAPAPATAPTTTVVNNSGNDMLTGVLIGNMLGGSHHDHTTIIEREVVREAPAKASRSSWDDISTPSSSKSSSWDDTPSSSSRSSSWDSDSSSSSSSWSSSSSSDSSSSWDSGSSSSSWD